MVLLKNENSVLPLAQGSVIAAVGRGIRDIVKGGGGTGDVFTPFVPRLNKACGNAAFIWMRLCWNIIEMT